MLDRKTEVAQKEKPPGREQTKRDTFTFRIPEHVNRKVKEASREAGVSQNDYILLMLNLGMLIYQGFIPRQKAELLHFLSHKQQ